MRLMFVMVLVFSAGLLGCHEEVQSDTSTSAQALEKEPVAVADTSRANQLERAGKAAWVEGAPIVQPVDWVAADAHEVLEAGLLKPENVEKLKAVPLPVLVPNDASLLQDVFVSTGDHWYSARLKDDTHQVYIKGMSAAFQHKMNISAEEKARLQQFQIYRTHQIVTLAAVFFGVAYTIDVECKAPTSDVRCTDDAYVLKLADSLVRAGGQP